MGQTNKKLIFISCGQVTDEEKLLGSKVKEAINATNDFEAYFAETVHNLSALGHHIFDAIHLCAGAISFLHKRGSVIDHNGDNWGIRSSVWVNQEIAILAFRQFIESTPLPVLVFKDNEVKLEGAMTSLIVNPLPLLDIGNTIKAIKDWLDKTDFPPSLRDEFNEKWGRISPEAREALFCLVSEGGVQVKNINIQRKLTQKFGHSRNDASALVRKARSELNDTGLVNCIHNIHSGDEMTLHPTWKWYILRAVKSISAK